MAEEHVGDQIRELAAYIGPDAFLALCLDLMAGADRNLYVAELRSLTGHAWRSGETVFDSVKWPDYWLRTWGARGLLHDWDERATDAVVAGLSDAHWRPTEMCLKVVARHDVAGAAEGAVLPLSHALPRVRIQALRALEVVGDSEHFAAALGLLQDERADVRRQADRCVEAMRFRLDVR